MDREFVTFGFKIRFKKFANFTNFSENSLKFVSGRGFPVQYYFGLLVIPNRLLVQCEIFVVL